VDHLATIMSNSSTSPSYTDKQGQYLAFISTYHLVNGRAPAEADIQRFFGVTPPSVHSMVIELERRGFIRRQPRQARSIEVIVADEDLPPLRPQSIKSSVSRY
jgi:DNA-binding MarR family transcriptional regulator